MSTLTRNAAGLASTSPPAVSAHVLLCGWQAVGASGQVMHSTFKRVAQDPEKMLLGREARQTHAEVMRETDIHHEVFHKNASKPRFVFNVPLMDLSPFPFHTSPLRSARSDRPKGLYQAPACGGPGGLQ